MVGGHINFTYKVTCGNEVMVVKVEGEHFGKPLGIDRKKLSMETLFAFCSLTVINNQLSKGIAFLQENNKKYHPLTKAVQKQRFFNVK